MAGFTGDFIITWDFSFSKQVEAVLKGLTRPTKIIRLPTPTIITTMPDGSKKYNRQYDQQYAQKCGGGVHSCHAVLNVIKADNKDHRPKRVAMFGFSENGAGLWRFLGSADGANLDFVYFCDALHAKSSDGMPWVVAHGDLALNGRPPGSPYQPGPRRLVVTHSSIDPVTYPSTTKTAKEIVDKLLGPEVGNSLVAGTAIGDPLPTSITQPHAAVTHRNVSYTTPSIKYSVDYNGLTIVGYNNLDIPGGGGGDHIYQAEQVMPRVLQEYLVNRWNTFDPTQGTCITES